MKHFICISLLLWAAVVNAQTTIGLVGYYPFDVSLKDSTGNSSNAGFTTGNPEYLCGVVDNALSMRGGADFVRFTGPVNEEFDTEDFTISFYFKVTNTDGIQYLLTKRRKDCLQDNSLYIRYRPATRNINVVLFESDDRFVNMVSELDLGSCWYHLTLVRDAGKVALYINGKLLKEQNTLGRIDLRNDGNLLLGGSECFGANETNFKGLIDEFRLYNRALKRNEIQDLRLTPPDRIATPDTIIFLGNPVDIKLSSTCSSTFGWSPSDDVSDPFSPTPRIQPSQAGHFLYVLQMGDAFSPCVASDSIRITVIDPSTLDCSQVYLPKAFTPNGDGLNDTYGISNPYAIQQLVSFEIFDRWGGRIFYTTDPFAQWDGAYLGKEVNPGVMVYRVEYVCNGETKVSTGSLMVMK